MRVRPHVPFDHCLAAKPRVRTKIDRVDVKMIHKRVGYENIKLGQPRLPSASWIIPRSSNNSIVRDQSSDHIKAIIYKNLNKSFNGSGLGEFSADDCDDDDVVGIDGDEYDGKVSPYEWIARKLARSQIYSFSACEGVGRTLKGHQPVTWLENRYTIPTLGTKTENLLRFARACAKAHAKAQPRLRQGTFVTVGVGPSSSSIPGKEKIDDFLRSISAILLSHYVKVSFGPPLMSQISASTFLLKAVKKRTVQSQVLALLFGHQNTTNPPPNIKLILWGSNFSGVEHLTLLQPKQGKFYPDAIHPFVYISIVHHFLTNRAQSLFGSKPKFSLIEPNLGFDINFIKNYIIVNVFEKEKLIFERSSKRKQTCESRERCARGRERAERARDVREQREMHEKREMGESQRESRERQRRARAERDAREAEREPREAETCESRERCARGRESRE
ncbi:hypothetical protein Syun_007181 [Stephania yunnanensis]|uniref:Uncharacterized protein n=1 Tax=Stephania yunnanensis TaxID=152371 RepID=A0AAP0PZ60_9MAGN